MLDSCCRRRKIVCVPSGNTELAQREAVFTRSSAQVFEVVAKVWKEQKEKEFGIDTLWKRRFQKSLCKQEKSLKKDFQTTLAKKPIRLF